MIGSSGYAIGWLRSESKQGFGVLSLVTSVTVSLLAKASRKCEFITDRATAYILYNAGRKL